MRHMRSHEQHVIFGGIPGQHTCGELGWLMRRLAWTVHKVQLRAAQVRYREERMSFLHFLTSVCAIVGGVFTVSGILDAFVYHGAQAVRKKVDLGKQI